MPIYAYRCAACGHAKDVLQKMSDPVLSTCPACGQEAFAKQLTAAGFQLKGSGWYATDFKGSGAAPAAKPDAGEGADKADSAAGDAKTDAKTDAKNAAKTDGKTDTKPDAATPAAGAPKAPAPAPAAPSPGSA